MGDSCVYNNFNIDFVCIVIFGYIDFSGIVFFMFVFKKESFKLL